MVSENKVKIFFILVGIIILVLVALFSQNRVPVSGQASKSISNFQIQACATADQAGTCESRLIEVGLILPEQCCQQFGKCCS